MTTSPNRKAFCDYHEGMFASESSKLSANIPQDRVAREAVAFHESGHAVMQHALGLGCSGITLVITRVMRDWKELTYCSGTCASDEALDRRLRAEIEQGRFNDGVLAHGVATAAGPAAERKYYLLNGLPFRMLGAAGSDRNSIDSADVKLASAGRKRFAYRRLVWRRAQLALENEFIWNAVQELANALKNYWPTGKRLGDETGTMQGAVAQAIMRRAGVFPGFLRAVPSDAVSSTPMQYSLTR